MWQVWLCLLIFNSCEKDKNSCEFFLGVYLGAGGFVTTQSLSNARITARASGCTPACISDWLKLLHISQLEQRVVSLILQSEWSTVQHFPEHNLWACSFYRMTISQRKLFITRAAVHKQNKSYDESSPVIWAHAWAAGFGNGRLNLKLIILGLYKRHWTNSEDKLQRCINVIDYFDHIYLSTQKLIHRLVMSLSW